MNRLYRLGRVHVMITNCLTAMVGVYFYVLVWQKPPKVTDTKSITAEVRATEQDYAESLRAMGLLTYACIIIACGVSFVNYKVMLKKSWEN